MKVFDAALEAIRTHRCYSTYDSQPTFVAYYACAGCNWTGQDSDAAERHLAEQIDQLTD